MTAVSTVTEDLDIETVEPFDEKPDELAEMLATFEGWERFVHDPDLAEPALPSPDEWDRMPEHERDHNAMLRDEWNRALPVVLSDAGQDAIDSVLRVHRSNRGSKWGRRGVAISGKPTVGKTTVAAQVGKQVWLAAEQRHPDGVPHARHTPVAYVSVPSGCTAKQLDEELCRFFGQPFTVRDNASEMTARVVKCVKRCRTELVIVDEIHNLATRRTSQGPDDHLKELANKCPATWVYVGVDVWSTPLFRPTGKKGQERQTQTAGRFVPANLAALRYGTDEEREEFQDVVAEFEDHLLLVRHKPGSLCTPDMAGYLWHRTQGRMSSLTGLLKDAAQDAVFSGEEAVTFDILDSVPTDESAQTLWAHSGLADDYRKRLGSGRKRRSRRAA